MSRSITGKLRVSPSLSPADVRDVQAAFEGASDDLGVRHGLHFDVDHAGRTVVRMGRSRVEGSIFHGYLQECLSHLLGRRDGLRVRGQFVLEREGITIRVDDDDVHVADDGPAVTRRITRSEMAEAEISDDIIGEMIAATTVAVAPTNQTTRTSRRLATA